MKYESRGPWDFGCSQYWPAFIAVIGLGTVMLGLAYGGALPALVKTDLLFREWRIHRRVILLVATLNIGSYLLTLTALRTGQASYVIALRQLSIAAGALLGWRLLREAVPAPRRVGIGLIVIGCVFLALVR